VPSYHPLIPAGMWSRSDLQAGPMLELFFVKPKNTIRVCFSARLSFAAALGSYSPHTGVGDIRHAMVWACLAENKVRCAAALC
jgi:hypothetical protein